MNSAVDSLLMRLKLSDLIPKFKEMKLDRIVNLRKLSEEELREAVPDDEQRNLIIHAISNRGTHEKRQQSQAANINPPRNADDGGRVGMSFPRGSTRGGMGRGVSRGGRGGGSINNNSNSETNTSFPGRQRACNHFFSGECKFGDRCRYSHDKEIYDREMAENGPRRPNDSVSKPKDYSEVCEIPTHRIKFLLAKKAERLKQIHIQNHTHNEPFKRVDSNVEKFELVVYGPDPQSVLQSKKMILSYVGVTKQEEQKSRLQYTINELSSNQHAAKLLAACNIKNEGTARELSEETLKSIISFFRFEKQQDVRHFYLNVNHDRVKLDKVAKIVAQLRGVQAIMFSDQKRVMEMSKVASKIARFFNGVTPLFLHREIPKEERMRILQEFKDGEENESGIRERLLITNEDYAKLARKTLIPYVNLVINYVVPRTEEYYLLQSLVAGRSDTVGVSILCVSPYDQSTFHELQQKIVFTAIEEESDFMETAVQLVYDTTANPLTDEDADPPRDWKEKLEKKNASA
ncbi:hypothetical protein C3747_9g357 [Trypanosoma cruzi]|uniref:ATP-dependent RNA helicase n=2 Tax=Trypanosoma cruzi TaxID=5693 RepID=Q4E396_TRYCC|nr:hypothetical protein, conserved [Trypanosoma cruzi]EAN99274.1 hypothetical protein, conserved [Trypanosoma cruzi]PWV19595.1 hypothetical protein C3747_9g357 [Trypanosoma cruzi]|eukprot:XP_821125.1 hypothetical protein [Trypanosoma cruzi strain CL Brener]